MNAAQIIQSLAKTIADHRDAGNGGIAHDLECVRARMTRNESSFTWKFAKLPNGPGMNVFEDGVRVATVGIG